MPELPPITISRSHRRSIALHIQPDGKLEVRAPFFVTNGQIQRFLLQHQDWIDKHSQKIKNTPHRETDSYLYLGKQVALEVGNFTEITVRGDKLLFPSSLLFRKDKELTNWYIKQAKEVITRQTEKYALEMNTEFKEITFSDTKSQWGRCTRDNRLQFSWRLIMTPLIVLNYVVIHELAHTMEKNHTQFFWMKVRNFNPSYRQQIKWLKDFGHTLKI